MQALPEAPESLVGYGCYDIAGSGGLRDALVSPILQLALPQDARVLIRDNLALPSGTLRHVVQTAKVCILVLEPEQILFAARSTGGQSGESARVFGASGASPAVTVFGDQAARAEGADYLARVVYPARRPVLSAVIMDNALSHRLRTLAEESLAEQVEAARAGIAAERRQHAQEARLGDPDVLVTVLERRIRRALAYIPDFGEARLSIHADGGALFADLEFDVHENSPLSEVLAAERPVASMFEHLPLGTAIAYQRAGEGAPPHDGILAALVEIGGARVDNSEAAQWMALADSMRAPFTLALGATPSSRTTPDHAWLQYEGEVGVLEVEALLATSYPETLIAVAFARSGESEQDSCRPRRWPSEGDAVGADCVRPSLRIEGTGVELGVLPAQYVSTIPDIGRLANPEPVLAAMYLDARRLPAALSLFGYEARAGDERATPILIRLSRVTSGGVRLRFQLAPHAAPALMSFALGMGD